MTATIVQQLGAARSRAAARAMVRFFICIVAVLAVTASLYALSSQGRPFIASALPYVFLVLIISARWNFRYGVAATCLSALAFTWVASPVGRFYITDPRDLFALALLVAIALLTSYFTDRARRSQTELRQVVETIPAMVWSALPDGSNVLMNSRWEAYTGSSAVGLGWQAAAHPDDLKRHVDTFRACSTAGLRFADEVRFRRADGQYRWFFVQATPLKDEQGKVLKWYGIVMDIEDRKRTEALLTGEKRILEMVAKGKALPEILDNLCQIAEEQASGVLASILLLDGNRLRHGGAPSLPRAYTDAIDGATIGPSAGSCGTAAYRREQVIVEDIATNPLWAEYRDLALPYGLRACWSTPVFSSQGDVIATFAMYYREPRSPSIADQEVIEQITHLAGVAVESKHTHEALRRSEAYLAEGQRLTHTGSWALNVATGKSLHSSAEHTRLFGLDPEKGIPSFEEFLQRVHPEDREQVIETFQALARSGGDLDLYYRIAVPGSPVRYMHAIGHPVLKQSGASGEYVGITIDITERKRAEERLHEAMSERVRLAAFREEVRVALAHEGDLGDVLQSCAAAILRHFEAAFARIWTISNDRQMLELRASAGMYTHLNGAYSRIGVGQYKIGLIAQERKAYLSNDVQNDARVENKDWARQEGMISFAGCPLVVEDRVVGVMGLFSKKPLPENAAETLAFVADAIAQGIGRKQAEVERERLRWLETDLAHLNRVSMMGELAASLGHEIVQPISGALMNANTCLRWLNRDQPNLEVAREAASRMVRDSMRAVEIIKRTSSLYKKATPQREPIDLNEVINEITGLLPSEASRWGISIVTKLAPDLPRVMGDRVQLQQVLLNLAINGVDAMKRVDGIRELRLSSKQDSSGAIVVTVADTGVGLPAEKNKIFDAFFTTKPHGTGMGLAISRSIIESHGGSLSASAHADGGAMFYFTLPIAAGASA